MPNTPSVSCRTQRASIHRRRPGHLLPHIPTVSFRNLTTYDDVEIFSQQRTAVPERLFRQPVFENLDINISTTYTVNPDYLALVSPMTIHWWSRLPSNCQHPEHWHQSEPQHRYSWLHWSHWQATVMNKSSRLPVNRQHHHPQLIRLMDNHTLHQSPEYQSWIARHRYIVDTDGPLIIHPLNIDPITFEHQ